MATFGKLSTSYTSGRSYMVDGALLNVLAGALNDLRGLTELKSDTIKITRGDSVINLEVATTANTSVGTSGGGGGGDGLPAGYTFTNFSICVNGSPTSVWWPTWTSDPS